MSPKRIGIMGGTFDPVHIGHLSAAEEARIQFKLDKVIFMPAGVPAFKQQGVTAAEHRYLMCVLATTTNPFFEVSRLEIDRPGVTYTIDTIRELKKLYPNSELFFITGADAVFEIVRWKDTSEYKDLVTFIATHRPGYDIASAFSEHADFFAEFHIEVIQVPALAVSSSDIRRRVAEHANYRYLTPDSVAAYIKKHGLYV